ncbi:MAG: presqualene diphosphate synthase HpnD [Acidocella sp.]|nr:presqualene diphosphate synthase HpnD [Acidocella sp.]
MTNDDIRAVTASVKAAGTSFYYGMKILPPARRHAMYGVYAFCRVVDDIADEDGPLPAKRAALDAWRGKIAAAFQGQSSDAITACLRAAIGAYELREADFLAIIDGMEMDAGDPIIAPDLATLDLYCDRVAAAVGRLSVRIFGEPSPAGQEVAFALGRALQLTNILRDVAEDAARGRLYLPREYLTETGTAPDPATILAAPALPVIATRVADMAAQNFTAAATAMARCNPRAMRPARLMAASYQPLLGILRAQNFTYTGPRARLPKWRKLALTARLLLP